MEKNFIKAIDVAKELGLYLKVVVSVKSFDHYNSFFNIYGESEKPCRRIVVLTPYQDLEEVNDLEPADPIEKYSINEGTMWIEEYPLLTNPNKINLEAIEIPIEKVDMLR